MKFSFRPITCIWTISNWRRNNANNCRKTEDFLENEEADRRNIEYKKSTFFFFLITYIQAHLENGAFLKIFTMGQFYTIFYRENIFGISFKEIIRPRFFGPLFLAPGEIIRIWRFAAYFQIWKKTKA